MNTDIKNKINKCKYTITKKNVSPFELEKVEYELKQCLLLDNNLCDKCYVLLGKLYFKCNELNKATNAYFNALKINDNLPSIYFGLFKIKVYENNIKEAYLYLQKYESLVTAVNYKVNLDDYYYMIKYILNNKKSNINKNGITNTLIIEDSELLDNYNNYIDSLLNDDLITAKNYLNICQSIVEQKNIRLDFMCHIKIINNLILKKNILSKNNIINLIRECSILIDGKEYIKAESSIKRIESLHILYDLNREINYLKNKLENSKSYDNLDINVRKTVEQYISTGHDLVERQLYTDALIFYTNALRETNHHIFKYYIGKMYYKLNNYTVAKEYLIDYNNNGVEKYTKSRLYLIKMYHRDNKHSKANKLINEIDIVNKVDNSDFDTTRLYYKKDNVDCYDKKPKKLLKKINMNIEEFNRK